MPIGYPTIVPLGAPKAEVDVAWKRLFGNWTCGKKSWSIQVDETGRPTIQYDQLLPFPLVVAAMAEAKYGSGTEVMNLVVDGLEVLIQLRDDDTIEVLNGKSSKTIKLVRA